jgi:hypothetical protein
MVIRTDLSKPYIKRPYRILYGFTQQTPTDVLLDPAWDRSVKIWPGMVAMKTQGNNVSLINGVGHPYGFFGEYIGGDDFDEPKLRGVNATVVWRMGPDAEAEVLAPSFDTSATWTDPADGTYLLAHAMTTGANRGKLVPAGTTNASSRPVCRVLQVSATKLRVGGLVGTV